MEVTLSPRSAIDTTADIILVAAGARWRDTVAALDDHTNSAFTREIQQQGFAGIEGETALFQTQGRLRARGVVVVGIGAGAGPTPWYKLAETTVRRAADLKARTAAVVLAREQVSADRLEILAEGLHLAAYTFDRLKSRSPKRPRVLERVAILAGEPGAGWRGALARGGAMARATCYARDLINLPAAVVTPTYLATEARRIARHQRLRLRVLDRPALKRLGMGALLGVAQGSAEPPRFIELIYRPRTPRRLVALAGKGITFDSGGLSLKPADAMQAQKRDMAGGAAVLGVMSVVRDLALPVEVRAYVPSTENMPGGRAIKPGDVLRAYNGTSIEVLNTDAEGRLVLADALSYAAAAKPDVLIDLATLTAAVRAALGTRFAAIMGTDGSLVRALIDAAQACGENLWELPLVAEYRGDLDSSVADIKNIGEGGNAGTIVAGLFLREFVGTVPWAHIDFSSTVMTDKPLPCHPRGATGFGVRTLLRYLRGLGG